MSSTFDMGDRVRVKGSFTDPLNSSAPIDPSNVYLDVTSPDGTTTTYTYGVDVGLTNDGTGVYYYDITLDAAGLWYYRWYSTGSGQASGRDLIIARPQAA